MDVTVPPVESGLRGEAVDLGILKAATRVTLKLGESVPDFPFTVIDGPSIDFVASF